MRKLIAANWKENPRTEKRALALFRATAAAARRSGARVAVCPPFVYLERIMEAQRREKNKRVALGAQDVFWEEKGPYTSEVGPGMLRSLGVKYVIVGHSERRRWMHETDAMINRKVKRALADGLHVILCVGEPLAVRRKGGAAAKRFVEGQLRKDLARVRASARRVGADGIARRVTVAYEPIWAIGTGRSDRPEDASAMAAVIKGFLERIMKFSPTVLYGGSVDSRNVREYVQCKGIGGALVGGASLRAAEFKKLLTAL